MIMLFKDGTFKLRGKEVSVAGQSLPVVEGYKVGVRGGYDCERCSSPRLPR